MGRLPGRLSGRQRHPHRRLGQRGALRHIARKNARQGQQVPLEDLPGLSVPAQGEDSLTQCILRLPARYRAWIQLHYAQGYTAEETAEILGLSKEAGYKLGQRAKQRLEILCREEGLL